MSQGSAFKFVGAVGNAVTIMRHLARRNGEGVASIARASGVNASTCFNILKTLTSERLVDFDPDSKTYRIGLGVLAFSAPLLGANQVDLIRPELDRLARERCTLIALWQITESEHIILVDRVSASRLVQVNIALGSRLPAYVGAIGRCYAASRDIESKELERQFRELRWQSPPSFKAYAQDVEQAKQDGYAFDFGQLFIGLETTASIIFDADSQPRFGISGIAIVGQHTRPEFNAMAVALRDTAEWISETLFGRSRTPRQMTQTPRVGWEKEKSRQPIQKLKGGAA